MSDDVCPKGCGYLLSSHASKERCPSITVGDKKMVLVEENLLCNTCKHSHKDKLRPFCDKSDLEIRYDILWGDLKHKEAEVAMLRERLQSARGFVVSYSMQAHSWVAAKEVGLIDEALATKNE